MENGQRTKLTVTPIYQHLNLIIKPGERCLPSKHSYLTSNQFNLSLFSALFRAIRSSNSLTIFFLKQLQDRLHISEVPSAVLSKSSRLLQNRLIALDARHRHIMESLVAIQKWHKRLNERIKNLHSSLEQSCGIKAFERRYSYVHFMNK